MNVDQEIRDGHEAQRLLDNPLFKKAFDNIESGLIDRMRFVPMADIDTQHELVLSLQLLNQIKKQVITVVQTGTLAKVQKESMLEKAKRVMRK